MAYSRSETTLRKILPELASLQEGRTVKWDTLPGRAWWKASKIREGLYIALHVFPDKYPRLAEAAAHFVVEVVDHRTVQARPTANTPEQAVAPTSPQLETPIHGLEPATSIPRTVVGQRTATDIISFWLAAQPTNDKLVFTECVLSTTELDQLARWAGSRTPKWMIVVSPTEGIVTLSPFQPGIPAWTPTKGI